MILFSIILTHLGPTRSDNTLLGGRTIDYGPFGWMEKYDPMYQVSWSSVQSDGMSSVAFWSNDILSSSIV